MKSHYKLLVISIAGILLAFTAEIAHSGIWDSLTGTNNQKKQEVAVRQVEVCGTVATIYTNSNGARFPKIHPIRVEVTAPVGNPKTAKAHSEANNGSACVKVPAGTHVTIKYTSASNVEYGKCQRVGLFDYTYVKAKFNITGDEIKFVTCENAWTA